MSESIFEDILNIPARDVIAPPPLPTGTYLAVVETGFEIKKPRETECIEFKLKLIAAQGDVDSEKAAEFPGGIMGTIRRFTLWGTNDPAKVDTVRYYMKEFLTESLGISDDMSLKQQLSEAAGRQLYITVRHVPSKDGKRMQDEIAATARA